MPRLAKKEVTVEELRKLVSNAIQAKHKCTIVEYARTPEAVKLLGSAAKHLPVYLSTSGSVSHPVLQALCKEFRIGVLEKSVTVVKTVTYYLV